MSELKIDKNVPMPGNSVGTGRSKYDAMQVGDSVLFESSPKAMNFRQWAGRRGFTIVGRTVENGFRMWLVSKEK